TLWPCPKWQDRFRCGAVNGITVGSGRDAMRYPAILLAAIGVVTQASVAEAQVAYADSDFGDFQSTGHSINASGPVAGDRVRDGVPAEPHSCRMLPGGQATDPGFLDGQQHAHRLAPAGVPKSSSLLLVGSAVVAACAIRRVQRRSGGPP